MVLIMASSSSAVRVCEFPFLAVRGAWRRILEHNVAVAYQQNRLVYLADLFVSWWVVVDRIACARSPQRLATFFLRREPYARA